MGLFDSISGLFKGEPEPKKAAPGQVRLPSSPPANLRLDKTEGDPLLPRLREAIEQERWDELHQALDQNRDWDDRMFLLWGTSEWDDRPDFLDRWVDERPGTPVPLIVRGMHSVRWAWQARGSGAGSSVSRDQAQTFYERLQQSLNDLMEAARLDPVDPCPWAQAIVCATGLDQPVEERRRYFDEATRRDPEHRVAHDLMLMSYLQKWGGSHRQSFDFALQASAKAPPGSPVHGIIATAHLERYFYPSWFEDNRQASAEYIAEPDVQREIISSWMKRFQAPRSGRKDRHLNIDHNFYAFLFGRMGQHNRARREFQAIGSRVAEWPWRWLGDPVKAYSTAWAASAAAS